MLKFYFGELEDKLVVKVLPREDDPDAEKLKYTWNIISVQKTEIKL